jgi:hypothetical protein
LESIDKLDPAGRFNSVRHLRGFRFNARTGFTRAVNRDGLRAVAEEIFRRSVPEDLPQLGVEDHDVLGLFATLEADRKRMRELEAQVFNAPIRRPWETAVK